jgi:MFS family permease
MGIEKGITTPIAALITVVGFGVVIWGYLLPVRRYLRRANIAGSITSDSQSTIRRNLLIGASLAGIALLGTWGAAQQSAKWSTSADLDPNGYTNVAQFTQITTSVGAIIFAFLAPFLANILNRRITYILMCAASLAAAMLFYQTNTVINGWFFFTAFLMGGITASFYGFFPLYLPELFPTAVRATGQGFCFNVGRIVAAVGGLQIANLVGVFGTSANAYSALCAIYVVGMLVIWLAPETKGHKLE